MNSRVSKNNRRKENHLKDTVIQLNRIDQARSVYDVITSVTLFQYSLFYENEMPPTIVWRETGNESPGIDGEKQ